MVYRVCLEIGYDGGWVFARLPDFWGCISKEKTRESALEKLPDSIRIYLSWLKTHGVEVPDSNEIKVDIVEVFKPFRVGDYEVNAFFEADRPPLSQEEVLTGIQKMEWSRQDLLRKTSQLPQEILDRKLDNRRSIRENLEHIATAEWWYLTRINLSLPSLKTFPQSASLAGGWESMKGSASGFEKMRAIRELAIERLSNLTDEERSRVTTHSSEEWSARKVLRRFLEHEREHIQSIEHLLKKEGR